MSLQTNMVFFFPGIQKKNLLSIILTQNELELFFWTESAQQTSWFGSETGLNISVCTEQNRTALVLNWALSHLFLFACLNCDLYLFVQVQEDAKESLLPVRRGSLRAHEHGARVLN